jgi:hypothetical protein
VADTLVRLGFALCAIGLISAGLYQFSARAGATEPVSVGLTLPR